jgi:hypothetical protein
MLQKVFKHNDKERFKDNKFTFVDAACVLSAFKINRSDKILFHNDVDSFVGSYWEKVKKKHQELCMDFVM